MCDITKLYKVSKGLPKSALAIACSVATIPWLQNVQYVSVMSSSFIFAMLPYRVQKFCASFGVFTLEIITLSFERHLLIRIKMLVRNKTFFSLVTQNFYFTFQKSVLKYNKYGFTDSCAEPDFDFTFRLLFFYVNPLHRNSQKISIFYAIFKIVQHCQIYKKCCWYFFQISACLSNFVTLHDLCKVSMLFAIFLILQYYICKKNFMHYFLPVVAFFSKL